MSLINTRRKPLSNNTDFNTGKTFNNNTATSKNNSDVRNIEFVAKKSKADNNINANNTDLPSSSSNNVPKNGVNLVRVNRSGTCSTLEDNNEKKKLNSQISSKKNRKTKKPTNDNNNNMKVKGENTFLVAKAGDPSTKHEKECFVNHNEPKKNSVVGPPRKGIRPVERERMRDWLCRHLHADSIRGLYWLEKKKLIFRIPWKHGSSQNWTEDDAELFVEWAKHTGRYYPDTDKGKGKLNTKRFKATFRCALNSLPDCQELSNLNNKAGSNAFKVYQFSCDKDNCPYKKKKGSGKTSTMCCDKSVECHEEDTCHRADTPDSCADDKTPSKECVQEKTADICDNDKNIPLPGQETPPSGQETPPKSIPDESCPVPPETPVTCTPCQKTSTPNPCRSNSSFDDLSISENDVANTLLELQRGTVSRLIKEKGLCQSQPQSWQIPSQSQMLPVTQLPVPHILQPQMPVPPQSQVPAPPQPLMTAPPQSQMPVPPQSQVPVPPQSQAPVPPQSQVPIQPRSQVPALPQSQVTAQPQSQVPIQPQSQVPVTLQSQLSVPSQSRISVPQHSQAQVYPPQQALRSQITKPVLQPQMQSVQVLQSQLTTHREIHPMTQSITYEQTSTMTVAHPVPSTMASVFPFVPAVVLPYTPSQSHSEPQMAKVCMIPAYMPSTATQVMNIHSNSFDGSGARLVPVAAPRLALNARGSQSEAPVVSIKQEVMDADYSPAEINNNNSNSNNNNIAVKLENVETGDVTPNYKSSEPKSRKVSVASTTVARNGVQTNTQAPNRKRPKEKKPTAGSVQSPVSRVSITSSAQNYLKKRKK